jgi:hypothetical protein
LVIGIALGVYGLPIVIAPAPPTAAEIAEHSGRAIFSGQFRRNLRDSDWFHWGDGTVAVGRRSIAFVGRLAPGPDYKLYLSPEFVETEADFARVKARMVRVADVRSFGNQIVPVADTIDVSDYNTAIIWCESFGQFITAARYR